MIRSLAPDELTWFLSQYYAFLGHRDPRGLARRVLQHARDLDHEAVRSFVLVLEGRPKAGANVLAPRPDEDDQNLYLSNFWFERDEADLERLLRTLLARNPHEAAHAPLYNFAPERIRGLEALFARLGFALETACDLAFDLAELPPLGLPLVLEAWSHTSDAGFRDLVEEAEAGPLSDATWAWFKRRRGSFSPDLWFIARETLDQAPVGYAFYGAQRKGLDGVYYLTAAGVLQEHRVSSEMLRRVVLSSMHELAARSPLGRLETTLSLNDPKLVHIFESLGFDTEARYPLFFKGPDVKPPESGPDAVNLNAMNLNAMNLNAKNSDAGGPGVRDAESPDHPDSNDPDAGDSGFGDPGAGSSDAG